MFARNLPSTSVCLRCRLRLQLSGQIVRSLPVITATTAPRRHRFIPSALDSQDLRSIRGVRCFATGPSLAEEPAPPPHDDEGGQHQRQHQHEYQQPRQEEFREEDVREQEPLPQEQEQIAKEQSLEEQFSREQSSQQEQRSFEEQFQEEQHPETLSFEEKIYGKFLPERSSTNQDLERGDGPLSFEDKIHDKLLPERHSTDQDSEWGDGPEEQDQRHTRQQDGEFHFSKHATRGRRRQNWHRPRGDRLWDDRFRDDRFRDDRPRDHGETPFRIRRTTRPSFLERVKKHRSGNRILTPAAESLGTDVLGKPAHAIVLKEGIYERRKFESLVLESDHKPAGDMAAMLETQRQPATIDEAFANINELRPARDRYLPEKEFRKLQETLTDGFLVSQLDAYIQNYNTLNQAESNEDPDATEEEQQDSPAAPFKWITSVSPWEPLPDDLSDPESTPRLVAGYLPPSAEPKDKLVMRVLRECWQLSIQELNTGIGETQVELDPYAFTLLMRGTQRFIHVITDIWLGPGERIEAFQDQHMLRIVTTRPKAEVVLKDLQITLERVNSKMVPLNIISPEPIDDALLEEIGRITSTYITRSSTSRRIEVAWIDVKNRDGCGLEDKRHIVTRLLRTALTPPKTPTALYAETSTDQTGGSFIVDKTNREKWSWKDKLGVWGRYVRPVSRDVEGQHSESGVQTKNSKIESSPPLQKLPLPVVPNPASNPEDSKPPVYEDEPDAPPPLPVEWSRTVETTTRASFGHVLHSQWPTPPPTSLPDLLATNPPHIFSPVTPHPLQLASLEPPKDDDDPDAPPPVKPKTTIVIRFWPSPNPLARMPADPKFVVPATKKRGRAPKNPTRRTIDAQWYKEHVLGLDADDDGWDADVDVDVDADNVVTDPSVLAPALELRLAASDTEILGVESLRAVLRTGTSDVMLPSSAVDLRFAQTQHVSLVPSPPVTPTFTTDEDLRHAAADALANWQPISDFLSNARLDLAHGKLEVPPRQKFPVPRRLFAPLPTPSPSAEEGEEPKPKRKGRPPKTKTRDGDELLSTSYSFVGLEVHRSASIPYADAVGSDSGNGVRLTYTAVEAGQGGGRRAEVSLEPVAVAVAVEQQGRQPADQNSADDVSASFASSPTPSSPAETEAGKENSASVEKESTEEAEESAQESLERDFLASCYRFARTETLWSGNPADRQRKSEESE